MWRKLLFHNERIEQGVRKSLQSGLCRISPDTGLIDLSPSANAMAFDGNWLFFGYNTSLRDCFTWHSIMFNCFGLVPEFCKMRCYKVVVKVRNFQEAMKFRAAILAAPQHYDDLVPIHGKVGKDERNYSDGAFNGFIYCDGLEDALSKYKFIRRLVTEQLPDGENINVIIKRTCTEFEKKHGPTDGDFWQSVSPEDQELERYLTDIYAGLKHSSIQPDWLQNKIINSMVQWANMIGDKTWIEYFDNCDDFLTMKAVTYHHLAKEPPK